MSKGIILTLSDQHISSKEINQFNNIAIKKIKNNTVSDIKYSFSYCPDGTTNVYAIQMLEKYLVLEKGDTIYIKYSRRLDLKLPEDIEQIVTRAVYNAISQIVLDKRGGKIKNH